MTSEYCGTNPDYSGVTIIELSPDPVLTDYNKAMKVAKETAGENWVSLCCPHGMTVIGILNHHNTRASATKNPPHQVMSTMD